MNFQLYKGRLREPVKLYAHTSVDVESKGRYEQHLNRFYYSLLIGLASNQYYCLTGDNILSVLEHSLEKMLRNEQVQNNYSRATNLTHVFTHILC